MSILLAPQICQTFSPEAIFHNERSYEKLRIMLKYTGIEEKSGDGRRAFCFLETDKVSQQL